MHGCPNPTTSPPLRGTAPHWVITGRDTPSHNVRPPPSLHGRPNLITKLSPLPSPGFICVYIDFAYKEAQIPGLRFYPWIRPPPPHFCCNLYMHVMTLWLGPVCQARLGIPAIINTNALTTTPWTFLCLWLPRPDYQHFYFWSASALIWPDCPVGRVRSRAALLARRTYVVAGSVLSPASYTYRRLRSDRRRHRRRRTHPDIPRRRWSSSP